MGPTAPCSYPHPLAPFLPALQAPLDGGCLQEEAKHPVWFFSSRMLGLSRTPTSRSPVSSSGRNTVESVEIRAAELSFEANYNRGCAEGALHPRPRGALRAGVRLAALHASLLPHPAPPAWEPSWALSGGHLLMEKAQTWLVNCLVLEGGGSSEGNGL